MYTSPSSSQSPGDIAPDMTVWAQIREAAAQKIIDGFVMAAFGVTPEQLGQPSRGRARIALARQVAIYLVHVILGKSMTEAGGRYNRDRTTASHACRIVEDHRDNHEFDRKVAALEHAITGSLELARAAPRFIPAQNTGPDKAAYGNQKLPRFLRKS